ncbi:hypothetical protein CRG98_049625 [Punica granatum]|uniref:Uncharacterized protein n=1 Tax=Punica granatum TaxID=22663 RepID=A0A2I0H8G2_PUNGR|nr:hypothetical protein CRG98_049625 [Punica granatum]
MELDLEAHYPLNIPSRARLPRSKGGTESHIIFYLHAASSISAEQMKWLVVRRAKLGLWRRVEAPMAEFVLKYSVAGALVLTGQLVSPLERTQR